MCIIYRWIRPSKYIALEAWVRPENHPELIRVFLTEVNKLNLFFGRILIFSVICLTEVQDERLSISPTKPSRISSHADHQQYLRLYNHEALFIAFDSRPVITTMANDTVINFGIEMFVVWECHWQQRKRIGRSSSLMNADGNAKAGLIYLPRLALYSFDIYRAIRP